MKIIVTKYALSSGCLRCIVKKTSTMGNNVRRVWTNASMSGVNLGTEAAETKSEAIEIVRRMIERKRASLTKQLARLDTLNPAQLVKDAKRIGGDA